MENIFGKAQQPGRWYKDGSGFRDAKEFNSNLVQAQRVFEPAKTDWSAISNEIQSFIAQGVKNEVLQFERAMKDNQMSLSRS